LNIEELSAACSADRGCALPCA